MKHQVEIGVRSPHADNRALAYGLSLEMNSGSGSNLHPRGHNEVVSSTIPDPPMNNNKVDKDTSTLKYSGARPKQNRLRPSDSSASANVNLLAERKASEPPADAADPATTTTMVVMSQLLDLLQSFNNDSLRMMALDALRSLLNSQPPPHSDLGKIFDSVAGHQPEFTPNLLENFLAAIQQPDDPYEHVEGAVAPYDHWYLIRHALTPYLFRRMSDVRGSIDDVLNKLENESPNSNQRDQPEDDLAEADQSCDGIADAVAVVDSSSALLNSTDWNEVDQVPTRLMSMLAAPLWSRAPSGSSPTPEDSGSAKIAENRTWFDPEDDHI